MKKMNSKNSKYYFEVLVVDTTGKVVINNENELCFSLMSNSSLFSNPEKDNFAILDIQKKIKVSVKKS